MDVVTFLLLLVIAAIAAGVHTWIRNQAWREFAARLVAYALLLTLPALLPRLLGG